MRRSMTLTTMILSLALVLSGCMERTGDLGNKNIRPNAMNKSRFANDQDNEQNRINGARRENNNVIGMHGNARIELSDQIAEKVNEIPGVDAAFVMMTDHNAYVAVTQEGTGTNNQAADRNNGSMRRTNTNSTGMISDNNNSNATGMSNNHNNHNGNGHNNSMGTNNGNGSGLMGNNNGNDLTDELKNQIADRVKSMSPSTENVYVSANPDFLGRMQGYADNVRQGHPIHGLVVEFNALVERIFPEPSGTRAR